jgi:FlaA1/EpsC-like NDP-sugar epimerase
MPERRTWSRPSLLTSRNLAKIAVDSCAWTGALFLATLIRYDFDARGIDVGRVASFLPLLLALAVPIGLANGLYTGRWLFGSFEEVAAVTAAALLTTAAAVGLDLVLGPPRMVPLSVAVAAGFIAIVLMFGARYLLRWHRESRARPMSQSPERMLVFGAGDRAARLIKALAREREGRYLPVALLDDDPLKRHLRITGIPVVGDRRDIAAAARQYDAKLLLIAVHSGGSALVGQLTELAEQAGLDVKVMPPVSELVGWRAGPGDIRDVTLADLLGRREVRTDLHSISDYLAGRRVLVSGAGGSIGAELCRQIERFAPAELIMVDQDGSALYGLELSLNGRALLDSPQLVVLDIRDGIGLKRLLNERRPEVVFHAAAFKHLTLAERHPGEAVRTNVHGTLNLLMAAAASGVERFVNVSTDKAADPTSVLGYTKRIGERLTAYVAARTEGRFLSVRFGNVLGTKGSVLGTFEAQMATGGPITVTDPNVTRYFMTVEEAIQLVIQAGAIGRDGEVLVLDMGEPLRIADMARALAARNGGLTDIAYTGLRPGEKLHEVLWGEGESDVRPVHPLIGHVTVPLLRPELALTLDPRQDPAGLVEQLKAVATAFPPNERRPDSMVATPESGGMSSES